MRVTFLAPFIVLPLVLSVLLSGLLSGCRHQEPNFIYMPDMVYSPALKAQKEGSMRMPVQGTVPRDFEPYPYRNDPEKAGTELKSPVRPTRAVLERGQKIFKSFCIECHGKLGMGDGSIIPKFPRPPSLQSEKVRTWSNGRIYHVITMGQNLMPSYASQISPIDRWKVIEYVRVIQRSQNPTPEDLKLLNQESK